MISKLGFLDALVGAVFLPKSSDDRIKAIQVLCYLSRNENIIPKLLDLNAIEVLKQHVNPDNLYALYTIANISRNKMGADSILDDKELMENLIYTISYSIARGKWEDRYVQRAVLTIFKNISEKIDYDAERFIPFAKRLDNIVLRPEFNTDIVCVAQRSHLAINLASYSILNPDGSIVFPRLEQGIRDDTIRVPAQTTYVILLFASTVSVGLFGLLYSTVANYYTVNYKLKNRKLNLFQKEWLRYQLAKVPLAAMGLYLFQEAIFKIAQYISNDVLTFEDNDPKQIPMTYGVYFSNIPVFFYTIKFAYHSIVTSLLPFRYREDIPPIYLKAIPFIKELLKPIGIEEIEYEPDEKEIESIITPPLTDEEAIAHWESMFENK